MTVLDGIAYAVVGIGLVFAAVGVVVMVRNAIRLFSGRSNW